VLTQQPGGSYEISRIKDGIKQVYKKTDKIKNSVNSIMPAIMQREENKYAYIHILSN
jgi:hypothetical protein